jgi:GT2 family glycosyltransferase
LVPDVFLVDDSSTDGTAQAVRARFPDVCVITGPGDLYWCRGMHRAFTAAMPGDYDFHLWLNDDTQLFTDALSRLLACAATMQNPKQLPLIIVGSTVDVPGGTLTYGGEKRVSALRPLRFQRIVPGDKPLPADSMNGNVVLVSRAAAEKVGNLDPAFEHAMGDTDYALRARRAGATVWVAPGIHGTCSHNPVGGTFVDANATLRQRWKNVVSRKGLPWRSWLVMTRRHGGIAWPLLFVWPYVSVLLGRYGRPGA